MSRGLGRRERQLLHAVYAHPIVAPSGRRFVRPSRYADNGTAYTSLQRAARSLVTKGLVKQSGGYANDLEPLREKPVSVHRVTDCDLCEHIGVGGDQR